MEDSENSFNGSNHSNETAGNEPVDPLSIDIFEPSVRPESPDPNESHSSASSSETTDYTIPGLITYYMEKPGTSAKWESLAIIVDTLDKRIRSEAAKVAERDEEIRRCHNVLVNITGAVTKRLFQMEGHMDGAHFETTLADELRRVGITPGPAYNGNNPGGDDQPEEEPAADALELEVNVLEMPDQSQSWNGLSKFAGTGEMPFSQWIVKLEDYFDLERTPLTSVQKIARVKFLLEGNARAYFNEIQEDAAWTDAEKKNYGKIKDALAQKFTAKAAKSLANQKLSVAQQTAGESSTQFANRIRQLVETATYGEAIAVKRHRLLNDFVRGLNPTIRIMVKKEEPADVDTAADWAQRLESLLEEESRIKEAAALSTMPQSTNFADCGTMRKEFDLITQQLGNLAQQVNAAQRDTPKPSHGPLYSSGDSKTPDGRNICGFCNKIGHSIVNCWIRDAGLAPQNQNKGGPYQGPQSVNFWDVHTLDLTGAASGWNTVTQFTGSGDVPFDQWLVRLEDLFDLQPTQLNEVQKAGRLKFYLAGNARAFFDQLPADTREAYSEAIPLLKQKFVARAAKSLANQKLYTVSQNYDEKVAGFANRIRQLVMTATIGEDSAVAKHRLLNEFIRGLKPSVRIMVKKEDPVDFDSALEYAIRFEGLLDEEASLDRTGYVNAIHTPTATPTNSGVTFQELQWMREQITALANKLSEQNLGTVQPVNDNKRYNEARRPQGNQVQSSDLQSARKCFSCGLAGHLSRNCRNRSPGPQRKVAFANDANDMPLPTPQPNNNSFIQPTQHRTEQQIYRQEAQQCQEMSSPSCKSTPGYTGTISWVGRPGVDQAEVRVLEMPALSISKGGYGPTEVSSIDEMVSGVKVVPKAGCPELDPMEPSADSTLLVVGQPIGTHNPVVLDPGAAITITSISEVPSATTKASAVQKERYDGGARERDIAVGDRVFLKNFAIKRDLSRNLDNPRKGLFRTICLTEAHDERARIGRVDQMFRTATRDQIKGGIGVEGSDAKSSKPVSPPGPEITDNDEAIPGTANNLADCAPRHENFSVEYTTPVHQVNRYGRQTRIPGRYQ